MTDDSQMNPLFYNRTISQILRMFVIPEVNKRIENGSISVESLPIEIRQFRASQREEAEGRYISVAEINEEVKLVAQVKFKKRPTPGMMVTIADIIPEECYLEPPKYNDKPAGYFYWRSTFLDSIFIFNLEYDVPDQFAIETPNKTRFPILDFLNSNDFIKVIKPLEKFRILATNNWPPAPGYCPQIMIELHNNPALITDESFVQVVSSKYSTEYWKDKLAFWEETDFFPGRMPYIQRAINAHYQDDYIASIHVIVPQFEGIITDYLKNSIKNIPHKFSSKLQIMKEMCLSRKVILYPKEVLEVILEFIDTKAFWKSSPLVKDQKVEINRHGIAHGAFTGFEEKEISLKLLILFDSLAYVLLNDRVVLGNL